MTRLKYAVTEFKFDIGRMYKKNNKKYIFLGSIQKDIKDALEKHYQSVKNGTFGTVFTAKKDEYLYYVIGHVFYPFELLDKPFDYNNVLLVYGYEVADIERTDVKIKLKENLTNIEYFGSRLVSEKEVDEYWVNYLGKLKYENLVPSVKEKIALFESMCIHKVDKPDLAKGFLYMNVHGIYYLTEDGCYLLDKVTTPANKMTNYKAMMFYLLCGLNKNMAYRYKIVNRIEEQGLVIYHV